MEIDLLIRSVGVENVLHLLAQRLQVVFHYLPDLAGLDVSALGPFAENPIDCC